MRFSIRDLFLVTAIVALAFGWWRDRSNLDYELRGMRFLDAARNGPQHHMPDDWLPTSQAPADRKSVV